MAAKRKRRYTPSPYDERRETWLTVLCNTDLGQVEVSIAVVSNVVAAGAIVTDCIKQAVLRSNKIGLESKPWDR